MNTQESITLAILAKLNFGKPDASEDELIREEICLCRTKPIEDFLLDRSSYLVGERGTGKTAVFELLASGKLKFADQTDGNAIVIPINETLTYKHLREIVTKNIVSGSDDKSLRYRALWEIYIIFYIIPKIKERGGLSDRLKQLIKEFSKHFYRETERPALLQLLLSGKKKVGIKFEVSPSGSPIADAYATLSADETFQAVLDSTESSILKVGEFKHELDKYLVDQQLKLYVLIDRLDEFVVRDDYEAQRIALESLLTVERSYHAYHQVKIKLFLRADLFRKLNLGEMGADKVYARRIDLKWSHEEIRDFLAKRILRNYIKAFGISGLNISEQYVDARSNKDARDARPMNRFVATCERLARRSKAKLSDWRIPYFKGKSYLKHSNFNETVNVPIIHHFLGEKVLHVNHDGAIVPIPTIEYLETHFSFNNGHSTPRMLLMFMDDCVKAMADYARKNSLSNFRAFPTIDMQCVPQAYATLRERLWETLAHDSGTLYHHVKKLASNLSGGRANGRMIKEVLRFADSRELDEFLAIINHLGIIGCEDKNLPVDRRVYDVPIMFQTTDVKPRGRKT